MVANRRMSAFCSWAASLVRMSSVARGLSPVGDEVLITFVGVGDESDSISLSVSWLWFSREPKCLGGLL